MPPPSLPVSGAPTVWKSTSTAGVTLTGSLTANNGLVSNAENVTLVGGSMDDTHYAFTPTNKVIEAAGGGIDTVLTWGAGFTLGANVENLYLQSTVNSYAVGNSGSNILTGNSGNNWIHGGGGLDVVTGGAGKDIFLPGTFANATTWITDLSAGDQIDLTGHGFTGLAQARAAMSQVGADVKINLGGGQSVMVANKTIAGISDSMLAVENTQTAGRTLLFSDEFNGPLSLNTGAAGTSGNTWKTTFNSGERTLPGNHELEYYVDPDFKGSTSSSLGLNPFSISNGILKISARPTDPAIAPLMWNKQYTSGLLTTEKSFQQQYGYFEIRADTPEGKGLWPAFWMLAPAKWPPEIDILEQLGNRQGEISQGYYSSSGSNFKYTDPGIDMTKGFHTYGLEWTSQFLTFFIDGKQTLQFNTPSDMNQKMYVLLNLAVGGDWPGSPDASVDWSKADLLVDYVRIYSLSGGAPPPPPPPPPPPSSVQVWLSNAANALDLTDSFKLPAGTPGTSTTFTGVQMQIAGVADTTTVTATYAANGDLTLTNNAAWAAIKNATVTDTNARGVDVRNFVDVEITLGAGNDSVAVTGAKRGLIQTNGGDDTITVSGTSTATTSNVVTIKAGTGNDTISFGGGSQSRFSIDASDGTDTVTITGQAYGSLNGGIGNDRLVDKSSAAVTMTGGTGADVFEISAGTKAAIADFVAGTDQVKLIGISSSLVDASISGADTILTIGGGFSVKLIGVNLTEAQINPIYG